MLAGKDMGTMRGGNDEGVFARFPWDADTSIQMDNSSFMYFGGIEARSFTVWEQYR
jgi:hypothetical protein